MLEAASSYCKYNTHHALQNLLFVLAIRITGIVYASGHTDRIIPLQYNAPSPHASTLHETTCDTLAHEARIHAVTVHCTTVGVLQWDGLVQGEQLLSWDQAVVHPHARVEFLHCLPMVACTLSFTCSDHNASPPTKQSKLVQEAGIHIACETATTTDVASIMRVCLEVSKHLSSKLITSACVQSLTPVELCKFVH